MAASSVEVQCWTGRRGQGPTAASIAHAMGSCRPCSFTRGRGGCKLGAQCGFCHEDHRGKSRGRPCKEKRQRIKRTVALMQDKVAQDPDLLCSGQLRLPMAVVSNPKAYAISMARLAQIAADAYRSAGRC